MPVLRGVDLDVPEGCLYGLIGPGAAGKSVLLKMLTGLMRPDRGRVIVDGQDVHAAHRARAPEVPAQVRDALPEQRALRLPDRGREHRLPAAPPLRPDRGRDRRRASPSGSRWCASRASRSACPRASRAGRRSASASRARPSRRPRSSSTTSPRRASIRSRRRRSSSCSAPSSAPPARPSIMVSSDLDRLLTVTDRVGMLYRGRLIFDGTTDGGAGARTEPYVRQFVHGLTEGRSEQQRILPNLRLAKACGVIPTRNAGSVRRSPRIVVFLDRSENGRPKRFSCRAGRNGRAEPTRKAPTRIPGGVARDPKKRRRVPNEAPARR